MSLDRLKALIAAIVAVLVARFDYHASYPARVVNQNPDGSLELLPDDPRFGPGVSRVPIRLGIPGASVTVKVPSRVLLTFENGDPTKPVATLWDASTLDTLTLGASTGITINVTGAGGFAVNNSGAGNVSVTQSGQGDIVLTASGGGGVMATDSGGNLQPVALVGDIVTLSGMGPITGTVGGAPFVGAIAGSFLGTITGPGSSVLKAS